MNREIIQPRARAGQFSIQLSATPRGARLARLLATEQLRSWGISLETPALVVAELSANAVSHGQAEGRDLQLLLTLTGDTLRIGVVDTRGDLLPCVRTPDADDESGRGLVLVAALAADWGVEQGPCPRKTVWAEVTLVGA